jgi:hypothetical protein
MKRYIGMAIAFFLLYKFTRKVKTNPLSFKKSDWFYEKKMEKVYSKVPYVSRQKSYKGIKQKKKTAKRMAQSMSYSAAIRNFNKQFK